MAGYTADSVQRVLDALGRVNEAVGQLERDDGGGSVKRIAYLGSSDFSKLGGTTPTCRRTYHGLTGNGFNPQVALQRCQQDYEANRMTIISVGPGSQPAQTKPPDLSALAAFYPAFRANPELAVIPWHEPENTPAGPDAWAKWARPVVEAIRSNCPGVKTSYCLMAWTTRDGGPISKWLGVLVPELYDYAGFDSYNNAATGTPARPGTYHNQCLAIARTQGKPLILAETGQDNRQGDPAVFWQNTLAWTRANPEVYAHAWWPQVGPNGDHTPTPASKAAFQSVLDSEPFSNVKGAKV